eukprot:Gb_33689 [translate_table: standard]
MARSSYYEEMVRAINNGPKGYKPPRYEKLRTTLIDNKKSRVEKELEPMRSEWPKVGCSIIMDGCTDKRNRPLLNIMVNCPRGPYFMRAIDCSLKEKYAIFQSELLCEAIEEVGPSYILQVITDATLVCKAVGIMVQNKYRHIYWTPCFVHAMNNVLKDLSKFFWIAPIIEKGREIQMFVCNHHQAQAIYRFYAKVELLKPIDTRYGTYLILLCRLLEVRGALSAMVIRKMWIDWRQSCSDVAIHVRRMILDDQFWVDVKFIVDVIEPIIDVICYGDTDSTCLDEVYETLDSMCE